MYKLINFLRLVIIKSFKYIIKIIGLSKVIVNDNN